MPAEYSNSRLETMRHSVAHIMAEAVQSIFPDVKFGIGPATEEGFYYDFDLPRSLTPDDLGIIEARQKFTAGDDQTQGEVEECGKVFIGEPHEIDREASETLGLRTEYLDLIKLSKVEFES